MISEENQVSCSFFLYILYNINVVCLYCVGSASLSANIKTLDLSYNNISFISQHYFLPIEPSLIHLYLSHNKVMKVTRDVFGNMMNLQQLDISHNRILEFEQDTFKHTRKLQVRCSNQFIK